MCMSEMIEHPLLTLLVIGVTVAGLGSFLVHSVERSADSSLALYDTAWYVALAELTVGYGQVTPKTDMGRLIAITVSVLAGGALVLLLVSAGGHVELRYKETRMIEELYAKHFMRRTLKGLACLYIQRKWRLHQARQSHTKHRTRLLLQMQEVHFHFRKKLTKSIKSTLNLDDEILLFDHNVFKVLAEGRRRLQFLKVFTRKASLLSTREMELTTRLLGLKIRYLRLILQPNYAVLSGEYRGRIGSVRRRNSIMSKKETDMARKRLFERIGGRTGSVRLKIDWNERENTGNTGRRPH